MSSAEIIPAMSQAKVNSPRRLLIISIKIFFFNDSR